MLALTGGRAKRVLNEDVEVFGRLGYEELERPGPFKVRLKAPTGRRDLILRLARHGRFFGGDFGMELTTEEPLLPETRGLSARGRGLVKMAGVRFRARRGDPQGEELAARLSADEALSEALGKVDFERVYVEPEGRPVIRHLGGSLVWVLFPPIIRGTPLPPVQAKAILRALDEFAAAARR